MLISKKKENYLQLCFFLQLEIYTYIFNCKKLNDVTGTKNPLKESLIFL